MTISNQIFIFSFLVYYSSQQIGVVIENFEKEYFLIDNTSIDLIVIPNILGQINTI